MHHQGLEPTLIKSQVTQIQPIFGKKADFISLFFHIQNCNTERKDDSSIKIAVTYEKGGWVNDYRRQPLGNSSGERIQSIIG